MSDDPIDRLRALSSVSPPPPSDELADRLTGRALPHRDPGPAARRHVVRLPVLLPAAAVAAIVLGFVLVAFGHSNDHGAVVLNTAVDASYEKDGQAVVAQPGTKLPEGAIITVGPTGSVQVGGLRLGPGERAIVRNGRLRRLARREARQEARATTTTTAAPVTTSTTAAPSGSPPAPTTTTTTAPESAPAWEQLPVAVQLGAKRASDTLVRFAWTQYQGGDFGAYVLVRDDRTVIARRFDVTEQLAADRAAPAGRTRYVLVILDSQRRPVARSEVVAV